MKGSPTLKLDKIGQPSSEAAVRRTEDSVRRHAFDWWGVEDL
nr:hypothetical protein [Hassalia byssoidea]